MPGFALCQRQDNPRYFYTHAEVIESQTVFSSLFAEILNTGVDQDSLEAISVLSHFINTALYTERAGMGLNRSDLLTRIVTFTRLERGIVLAGTMLDGRDLDWKYESSKLDEWLIHMGLKVEKHPEGHHIWSPTIDPFRGDRIKVPCNAYYQAYKLEVLDYPRVAYLIEYMSGQLMQLAGKIKHEQDRKIILFLSAVCRLGYEDLISILENKRFLDRGSAKLFIQGPANDIGIVLKDCEPYPFRG